MSGRDNADGKWSESVLEEEDSERTMNCLRGRLLAERMASRNARDQAEKLGEKLMELEILLKKEANSRNRAEKRLKYLRKKLAASMNIPFLTNESCLLLDIADISSVSSSTASSSTKEAEKSQDDSLKENGNSKKGFVKLPQNDSHNCFSSFIQDSSTYEGSCGSGFGNNNTTDSELSVQSVRENASVENSSISAGNSTKESQLKVNQKYQNDELSIESSTTDGPDQEDDQDAGNNHEDNSMALVSVDMPQENQTIDPQVLDGTVKEVLDTLRRAKEQLLISIERRRRANMIKVG